MSVEHRQGRGVDRNGKEKQEHDLFYKNVSQSLPPNNHLWEFPNFNSMKEKEETEGGRKGTSFDEILTLVAIEFQA